MEAFQPPAGRAVGPTVSQTEPTKEKPLTEAQSKSKGFADRMEEAEAVLTGGDVMLDEQGLSAGESLAGSIPFVGNYMVSPEYQQFEQAKRNFVTAVLRKESGAAISAAEFESEEAKYFPRPGDSPQVIEQKRRARQTAIQAMREGQGVPNAPTIPDETQTEPQATGGWGKAVRVR